MRIRVISRDKEACTRERTSDMMKVFRNYDPAIHPFERAREYTRALNATKLERVFAKPFVGALNGHKDTIYTLSSNPVNMKMVASGSCDGEIRVWDLSTRDLLWAIPMAHDGFVRSVVMVPGGKRMISCGDDEMVKIWSLQEEGLRSSAHLQDPISTFHVGSQVAGMDHHFSQDVFVTCGDVVRVWNEARTSPVDVIEASDETFMSVRFNPVERTIVAGTTSERAIVLMDIRSGEVVRKVRMEMKANRVAWNPQEGMNFVAASEDRNLYSFDMRKMDSATCVHMGHAGPVMDVDFSPTGREFVSGSYDKTVAIFRFNEGHWRDLYHTKRMQRVFCVKYSADAMYCLSGSDDTNVRVWKASASAPERVLNRREREHVAYVEKLKKRYGHMPEIRRIIRHRHLPKLLHKSKKVRQVMSESERRKEERRLKASKIAPDTVPERKKHILGEE